jgi:hypothetical protein
MERHITQMWIRFPSVEGGRVVLMMSVAVTVKTLGPTLYQISGDT